MTKPASKPTSESASSFTGWWRRLFAGSAAQPAPVPPQRTASAQRTRTRTNVTQPGAAPAHNDNAEADPAWLEHCPDFAAHAHALGLPYLAPPALSSAQAAQVEQLAAAVRAESAITDNDPAVMPAASLKVLQLVAREDLEYAELVAAVQQDPALTAAVLRMANSAAQGAQAGSIQTVRDAVTRMGVTDSGRVVGVVATQALFNPQSKAAQRMFGELLSELHTTSSAAASGAAQLSMERKLGRSDLAYLGGMLHDVGKSLAVGALVRLIHTGDAPAEVDSVVVQALLEEVSVDLGSMAHARWGLPQYLVDLCAQQHQPTCPLTPETRELHLVRVVGGLLALRTRPQSTERILELVDSLDALAITPVATRSIDAGLRSRGQQVRQVLTG